MTRKVIFMSVLMVLIGLGVSVLVLPSDDEVSLIILKERMDSRYAQAQEHYRKRLESGEVSIDVVMPLVKLYVESGAVDKAIAAMEQFVTLHPDSVEARNELGRLYQLAKRSDDYIKNLEALSKIKVNREVLTTLSNLYKEQGQTDKQAQVLTTLAASKAMLQPQQVVDLANHMLTEKKTDEAIALLQKYMKEHPQAVSEDIQAALVNARLDKGEVKQAVADVRAWKKEAHEEGYFENVAQMARLIHLFSARGLKDNAQQLLSLYGDDVFRHTPLLHEQVRLFVAFGEEDKAYTVLSTLYDTHALPTEFMDSFLVLALKRHDTTRMEAMIQLIGTDAQKTMQEAQAIALVDAAVVQARGDVLRMVQPSLGAAAYRQANALFSLVYGLAMEEAGSVQAVQAAVDDAKTSSSQLAVIARHCFLAKQRECALAALSKAAKDAQMSAETFGLLAQLYEQMQRYEEGVAFIESHQKSVGSVAQAQQAWVRMAAALGKDDAVTQWIKQHPALADGVVLHDVYFMANAHQHYTLAAAAAAMLRAQEDTPQNRGLLAHAQMRMGQYKDALALYTQGSEGVDALAATQLASKAAEDLLGALVVLAQQDAAYRTQLGEFAAVRLARDDVDDAQKMALVYALLDAKLVDVALPAIKEFARRHGGAWVHVYAQNLERQGLHEAARALWSKGAQQQGVSALHQREIAGQLLAQGQRDDAEKLLMARVEHQVHMRAIESKDLEKLLFIWGARPSEEQMEWLYQRAKQQRRAGDAASQEQYQRWMDVLYAHANSETIVSLGTTHKELWLDTRFLPRYVDALHALGMHRALAALEKTLRKPPFALIHMRILAKKALEYHEWDVAQHAYEYVALKSPNDEEALRELGTLAMADANYSAAKEYMYSYLNQRAQAKQRAPESYLAYYQYATMLRRDGFVKESLPYYKEAINVVASQKNPTQDMQVKRLEALAVLGETSEAFAGYEQVLAKHPQDRSLRLDVASVLLEHGNTARARELLVSVGSASTPAQTAQPLTISAQRGYTAYRVVAGAQEILFAFDPTHPPAQPLTQQELKAYDWIAQIKQGYDRSVLVLREGWRAQASPQPDGSMVLSAQREARSDDADVALRSALVRARVEMKDGKPQRAVDALRVVEKDYKNDARYVGMLASAEYAAGRWAKALRLAREAQAIAPQNESVAMLKREIEHDHTPQARLDTQWRSVGKHDEIITVISQSARLTDDWQVAMQVQHDAVRSGQLQRADGRVGTFRASKETVELSLQHTREDGRWVKGALFANNDRAGVGLAAGLISRIGQTVASVDWQRPYTTYVEAVLDDATRDRIALEHRATPLAKVKVQAQLAANRYNVKQRDDVMRTASASVKASYALAERDNDDVSVFYEFDGEYELEHEDARLLDAQLYRPFPLRSNEVHTVGLAGHHEFAREDAVLRSYADWMVGYAVDRLGDEQGAVASVAWTHELTRALEAQVRAAYGIGQGQSVRDESVRAGGYVMYRY
jgi:thioredoxin-like negative regulator of GroEL